jgi:hypothetical protein
MVGETAVAGFKDYIAQLPTMDHMLNLHLDGPSMHGRFEMTTRKTLFEMKPYWLTMLSALVLRTRMLDVHARVTPLTCPLPESGKMRDVQWLGQVSDLITTTVDRGVPTDKVAALVHHTPSARSNGALPLTQVAFFSYGTMGAAQDTPHYSHVGFESFINPETSQLRYEISQEYDFFDNIPLVIATAVSLVLAAMATIYASIKMLAAFESYVLNYLAREHQSVKRDKIKALTGLP